MTGVGRVPLLEPLEAQAVALQVAADQAISAVEAERDRKVAEARTRAVPLVTKNQEGQFFVTLTHESYVVMGMQAAIWQLSEAARLLNWAIKDLPPGLPPGSRPSWRRGTWA